MVSEKSRYRLLNLLNYLVAAALLVTGILLYHRGVIKAQQNHLLKTVNEQVNTFEAMLVFQEQRLAGDSATPLDSALELLRLARREATFVHQTEEILLARREGSQIIYLFSSRMEGESVPPPLSIETGLGQVVQRALNGETGVIQVQDANSPSIIAAYSPIGDEELGLVAKVDLAEIRSPVVRTAIISTTIVLLLATMGTFLISRFSRSILKQLESRKEQWEFAVESSGDGIWEIDIPNGITILSKRYLSILGYTQESFGSTVQDMGKRIHPDDIGKVTELLAQHYRDEIPEVNTEYRMRCQDGSYLWVLLRGKVIQRAQDGTPLRSMGTLSDIHHSKLDEESLHTQRALAEALQDTAASLSGTLDLNQVLERILENVGSVVSHDVAEIFLLDEDLYIQQILCSPGHDKHGHQICHEYIGKPVSFLPNMEIMLQQDKPQLISNVPEDPLWVLNEASSWIGSHIAAPIRTGNSAYGSLSLSSGIPDFFTEAHAEPLMVFAHQASIAIENARLFEKAQQNAAEAETLRQAGAAVAAALDLDKTIERILEQLKRVVPHDSASIMLVEGDYTEIVGGHGFDPEANVIGMRFPFSSDNPNHMLLETRKPLLLADAPAEYAIFRTEPHIYTQSWLGVPIFIREKFVGVIALDSMEKDHFTSEHTRLVTAFADQVTIAIQNARLYEEAQRSAAEAETLQQAGAAVVATLDLEETIQRILEQLERVVPFNTAAIMLIDDNMMEIIGGRGFPPGVDVTSIRIPFTEDMPSYEMRETLRPKILADAPAEYAVFRTKPHVYTQSWLGVPIRIRDDLIGIFTIDSLDKDHFTEEHARLATAFADQVAIALENAHLYSAIQQELEDRRQLEATIVESEKMAALGTLAAGMAHEINSPLQVITGLVERHTRKGQKNPPGAEMLERDLHTISRNAWRVANIVQSLLAYARTSVDEADDHDISDIVRDTLLLVGHQLKSWSNIEVITDLEEGLPPLHGERDKLTQALINLLTNARDAMPDGGVIHVKTSYDAAVKRLLLQVVDSGVGMPEEIRSRIFDPFFTTKEIGKGTGLGLSIVSGIVQAHGGEIQVSSVPQKGTTFSLCFPPYDQAAD